MEPVRCEWKDWRSASASLREWRGAGEKRSDVVLQLGSRLLKNHSSCLGPEGRSHVLCTRTRVWTKGVSSCMYIVWDVHEQVCVAALDCGDMGMADVCWYAGLKLSL